MTSTSTSAVADAGPLIHLSEIGQFQQLHVFNKILVPDAVWVETIGQKRVPEDDVVSLGSIQRHSLPREEVEKFIRDRELDVLHKGEQECLFLCLQLGVLTLLTDDLVVREEAKRLGLTPVGSLGVIIRAYRLERISLTDAERYLDDLYTISSLFVTRTIVELAVEQLHERMDYSGGS
ncbi:MAG TPA: hypothetical protein VF177_06940 [Anaerolineae bacterium]